MGLMSDLMHAARVGAIIRKQKKEREVNRRRGISNLMGKTGNPRQDIQNISDYMKSTGSSLRHFATGKGE